MFNILILGLGGFLGAVSRYLVSTYVQDLFKYANFPYGTLVVNILGCFVIGLLTHIAGARDLIDAQTRLFLMVGFVGAFTTFSTFSMESASLFQNGQNFTAALYLIGSNILGIVFVFVGQAAASQFVR
jgi:CrcB protein